MLSLQSELPANDRFSFFEDDAMFDPRSEGDREASFRCMQKSSYSNMREEASSRYCREMVEMVRDLPEYAYELSLRDLVELPAIVSSMQKACESGRNSFGGFWSGEDKTKMRKEKKRRVRSESAEFGGFFLRMFFLLPLSGKKKSLSRNSRSCSAISSKSLSINGEEYGLQKSGDVEKEKKLGNPSRGSRSHNSKKASSGCYPFFHTNKNKDLRGFC